MASDARSPHELDRLRARERARRFLAVGICVAIAAAAWLLLTWRASRFEATECQIVQTPDGYCSATHRLDGETHELPREDCSAAVRWRRADGSVPPVGARIHCYYYLSFPSDIVFEPPVHRGASPFAAGVLLAGAGLGAFGLVGLLRTRRPVARKDASAYGYRAPAPRIVESRPPLAIPLAKAHWSRWVLGAPFFLLGLALVGLSLYLTWQLTGDLDAGALLLLSFSTAVLTAGLFGLFFRSGIVLDADQNLAIQWWGLVHPWFRTVRALDALRRVEAETRGAGRATAHFLTLHFDGDKPRRYRMLPDEAARIVALIGDYRSPAVQAARLGS